MLLNGYTVLSIFICLLRFVLSVIVVTVGFNAWRFARGSRESSQSDLIENRSYLLILSATVLIGLNILSWPILYLLLQSYVQEWPAAMCIYGVTQIGADTLGASRFLPSLLTGLQWTKPLLIFVGGSSYIFYLLNRRTQTAPLMSRVLLLFLLTGLFSVADSTIEGAYLLSPKAETRLAGGCCTNRLESIRQDAKFNPVGRVSEEHRPYLVAGYYALNFLVIAGLFAGLVSRSVRQHLWMKLGLIALCLISIPVTLLFLIEIAAPAILGLPFHRCAYDLVSAAPESLFGVALFVLGCFGVGWSLVIAKLGNCNQTRDFLQDFVARLMFLALFGYAGSVLLFSVELFLAG